MTRLPPGVVCLAPCEAAGKESRQDLFLDAARSSMRMFKTGGGRPDLAGSGQRMGVTHVCAAANANSDEAHQPLFVS
jgi:hypothetical protein